MNFLANINLNNNELQNVRLHNLAVDPANKVEGLMYYNSKDKKFLGWNGTSWVDLGFIYTHPVHTIADITGLQTALDNKASTAVFSTSANGLVPKPAIASSVLFLRSDGSWDTADGGNADTVLGFSPDVTALGDSLVARDRDGSIWAYNVNASEEVNSYDLHLGREAKTSAATNYYYDDGTGYVYKKSLANTRAEIVTSAAVTSALGFTPYNSTNPSGYITASASITGNAATATKLQNARSITLSGDISGTASNFDGSANASIATTLPNIVTAGTATKITYNAKGQVTAGGSLAETDIPTLSQGKITNLSTDLGAKANKITAGTVGNLIKIGTGGDIADTGVHIDDNGTTGSDLWTASKIQTVINNATSGMASSLHTPVADLAAAKAIAAIERSDKMLLNIEDLGLYRWDAESVAVSNNSSIIRPTDIASDATAGRWIKMNSTVNDHNNLDNIQGGTTGQYYHLTQAQQGYVAGFTSDPQTQINAKEPSIGSKKTAFNVDFETTASNIKMDGTQSVGVLGTAARADHVHPTDTTRAPLASPALTGVPTAPTAAADTNTTQLATTAFYIGQASAVTPSALGNAAVGTSLRFARADHVHQKPTYTATDVGLGNVSNVLQASKTEFDTHTGNSVVHITSGERNAWNAKTGKAFTTIGDGTATTFLFTHNLNTIDVAITIRENGTPYEVVYTDVVVVDVNTIKISFNVAPTAGKYRVTVVG